MPRKEKLKTPRIIQDKDPAFTSKSGISVCDSAMPINYTRYNLQILKNIKRSGSAWFTKSDLTIFNITTERNKTKINE